jgi:hypothetical protein
MIRYFFIITVCIGCMNGVLSVFALAQERSSIYEHERMNKALRENGFEIHPEPEGRIIAFIHVARHDVFVDEEPWPTWFNIFHWLTNETVITRELLFRKGDPYSERVVQETMRNLRGLGIFSLVSIVAVKIPNSEQVGVVVHTRDLWSLRLEHNIQTTDWRFDYFYLQLTERNLFGHQKSASVRFSLFPFTYRVGQVYVDRRFLGEAFRAYESLDLIINRDSGEVEGSVGNIQLGRPFYDLKQRWAFDIIGNYYVKIERDELNGKVKTYKPDETFEYVDETNLPLRVYDDKRVSIRATGQYRHGTAYKQTLITGVGFRNRAVAPNSETNLAPELEAAFARDVMPKTRRDLFPFIGYGLYLPKYVVFEDLATFGQSESVRIGPTVSAVMEFPLRTFGSSTDSYVPYGELGYVWSKWDALFEIALSASARLEDGRVVDQLLETLTRGATPSLLLGRLIMSLKWEARRADTSNTTVSLGGDNGLRGYKSKEIQSDESDDFILGNIEYRTLPLKWKSVHLGMVLFYDIGSVYYRLDRLKFNHASGIGLRLLFPQFHSYLFRLDFGVPLDRSCCEVIVSFGGSQAVTLHADEDAAAATEY